MRGVKKKSNFSWVFLISGIVILAVSLSVFVHSGNNKGNVKETITIAVLQEDLVQDFNSNYYTKWLESQTGYTIQFINIPENYKREYIRSLLSQEEGEVDGIFFSDEQDILSEQEYQEYWKSGKLYNIQKSIMDSCNLTKVFETYENEQLKEKMTEEDGGIYYMPQVNNSRIARNFQIMWINVTWLKELELAVPKTPDELHRVLQAFQVNDVNKNGVKDEIALLSSEAKEDWKSYNYLLNAYAYNDPFHNWFTVDGDTLIFSPTLDSWRRGISYCNQLFEEKLLYEEGFSFSEKQVRELVNDPENLVGAFTSKSVADVVYANSPEILSRYIQVPPLSGDEQNAVLLELEPTYGGIIPANSKHTQEAFIIMDTMLSAEGSLIGEYGEENVDWRYSEAGELSTYGTKAEITTIQYLKDKVQNKNYRGVGPHVVGKDELDCVTWNGNSSDVEYINARAAINYEPYYPSLFYMRKKREKENIRMAKEALKHYMNEEILAFVEGKKEIKNDMQYELFLNNAQKYVEIIMDSVEWRIE